MPTYTQKERLISLSVDGLGEDDVLLQSFTGMEGLSRLYTFQLELLSQQESVDFTKVLGKKAVITLATAKPGTPRYIHGFVSRFAQSGFDPNFYHYHMEIVPWLWFLTRQADCRIFQQKSVPQIVSAIFDLQKDKSQKPDYKMNLNGNYETLEYCVQYRETSFNSISRLLEQEGMFYYFEHTKDSHTLVVTDNSSSLPPCPVSSSVVYDPIAVPTEGGAEIISEIYARREFKTGQYTLTDYNFETPSTNLKAQEQTVIKVGGNDPYEIFDYPGLHTTIDEGKDTSKIRMEEHEAAHQVIVGSGRVRDFMPGRSFTLSKHYRGDMNTSYLITEVRHSASEGGSYYSNQNAADENSSVQFHCIPKSIPYRPSRVTPKPFVQGPQPALVVGKSGEEIWVDKYGRVVVQFYWDRLGQKNENSSCWIRVSQPWAGSNWGAMWIPRIGQEVLVSFLEGDPDRPVITGRVYNAEQMPPYTLPDYQTRSTFKSRSSKGGGSSNYNELRFEDLKGQEQIFMNAEKDMDLRVENDSREYIGANRHLIVTANQQEKVNADKHLQVVGNHLEKISGNMSLQVTGNQMESVTGNKSLSVTGNQSESVTGNVSLSVTQGKTDSITMGYAMTALTIHFTAKTGIVIECPMGITLSSGANSIDITPTGVFIKGTPFAYINSGSLPANTNDPSAGSPDSPQDPKDPDTADDGSKGTKLN